MAEYPLLPSNATALERALEKAISFEERYGTSVDRITGWKYRRPFDPQLVPVLLAEYGLGDLSDYVDHPTILLDEGIDWQRVRGTPEAISRALGWLGYSAVLEEAPKRRRKWHLFQLGLNKVRTNEEPDLDHIEEIARLSTAVRSRFFRGFAGYDVRAGEFSFSQFSKVHYSQSSGVRRRPQGALWSFGRDHDYRMVLTRSNLEDLGVFIADYAGAELWATANRPWATADELWTDILPDQRLRQIARQLAMKPCWCEFRTADALIGYRRCRRVVRVITHPSGPIEVEGQLFAQGPGFRVYVEALTDFGDGAGKPDAVFARLHFGAYPAPGQPPGLMWANTASQLVRPHPPVANRAVNIKWGQTVRERVKTILRVE